MSEFPLIDLVLVPLAATQLVELWLDGAIFAGWQERFKARRKDPRQRQAVRRISELLTCPVCLLPWVSLGFVLLAMSTAAGSYWRLPLYMFATTRLGHLINDVRERISAPVSLDETEEIHGFELEDESIDEQSIAT